MTYKVLKPFQIKTYEKIVEFKEGMQVDISEEKARQLVESGKIIPIKEYDKANTECSKPHQDKYLQPDNKGYIPTKNDLELNRVVGKWDPNPDKFHCSRCDKVSERYCFGMGLKGRWTWGWFCTGCEPFNEN